MSTLKTTNLQHASAASPAIVLAADGSATAQLSSINGGPLAGSRNRIINGDMRIDQRNAGASVNTNGSYPVDRFRQDFAGGGVITAQRSTTAPAGFTNSASLTVSTADSSIAAGDYYLLQHRIEGFNTADFGFGAAGAATVTMSFWARSSVTGTYGAALHNDNDTRAYVFTYTINAVNTWEYKTITIAGDTTGTWSTGNTTGISIIFDFGSGTNFNGTAGTWAGSNVFRTSGCVNWIANSGATFYITGVQLEAGTVATPFERIDYSESLRRCQRYYQTTGGVGRAASASTIDAYCKLSPQMRTAPSLTIATSSGTCVQFGRADSNINAILGSYQQSNQGIGLAITSSDTGMVTNASAMIRDTGIAASAEL